MYKVTIYLHNPKSDMFTVKDVEFSDHDDAFNLYTALDAGFKFESSYADYATRSFVQMYNISDLPVSVTLLYSSTFMIDKANKN